MVFFLKLVLTEAAGKTEFVTNNGATPEFNTNFTFDVEMPDDEQAHLIHGGASPLEMMIEVRSRRPDEQQGDAQGNGIDPKIPAPNDPDDEEDDADVSSYSE